MGSNAFFQMLHQGTEPVPIDFLLAAKPDRCPTSTTSDLLAANCFAQRRGADARPQPSTR